MCFENLKEIFLMLYHFICFRNPIFLPTSSNLLKVSAFQGIINSLEQIGKDPSSISVTALKTYYQDIVNNFTVASNILKDIAESFHISL